MQPDAVLDAWIAAPDPTLLSPAALRLARRVPRVAPSLDAVLTDPLERALAGLGPVPEVDGSDLQQAVLAGQARVDRGERLDPLVMAALEQSAQGDPQWWVPAARLHVLSSEARERQARMALSEGDLPYVFPGELHPMMVDALAVGDRVLTALHVDWMRKLTGWISDALVLDLRQRGLWFWPQLRFLSERKIIRPMKKQQRLRRGQPGSRGLAAGYLYKVGGDWRTACAALEGADALHAALAVASDRPD
ncbi:MAG: hypothetical protein VX265_16125 [Myxococcota bacterium]|nr:hypothetical protein [Myxococcota bacterium]